MKFNFSLGFLLLIAVSLCSFSGCKDKDEFGRNGGDFFLNGESVSVSSRALYSSSGRGRIYLNFISGMDERTNHYYLYFDNLFPSEFRYDFGQTDVESQITIGLYILIGEDVVCDVYDLDRSIPTNYIEVSYFSEEECVVRGSYDLTFIRRVPRFNPCNNPRYGDTLRLVSDGFTVRLQGC